MTPDQADAHAGARAAYVHIPFCSAVCPYCDFAVVAGKDHLARRYIDAVCLEMSRSRALPPLQAVYLGGGTPSHIEPELVAKVLSALDRRHGIDPDAEVSIEVNPEDFTLSRAAEWKAMGINRVSFGAQSLDEGILSALGRRHGPVEIEQSLTGARRAGFENVSVDLIYGTPGESEESWQETVSRVLALTPDHVSCYALTVEAGTPLGRAVRDGALGPDPDVQAGRYEVADELLAGAGYHRYEVSNWSRPGRECRYNSVVWAQGEYEAYGNGAHGYRDGVRFHNIRRVEAYIDAVEDGRLPRAGEDRLEGWAAEIDRLFVGLRRAVGVADGPGVTALLDSHDGKRLVEAGVISHHRGRLVVARPLLTDEVHRAVLGLQSRKSPPVGISY